MFRLSIVAWALALVSLPAAAPARADEYTVALDGTRRNDRFGEVVSVDGDTLVVGAPRRNAAYVFARRNGVWTFVQDLAPRPIHPDRRFGTALAVLGDWIAVGATWTLDTATPGSVSPLSPDRHGLDAGHSHRRCEHAVRARRPDPHEHR